MTPPPLPSPRPARLALEDGTVVTGTAVGAAGEAAGELCFNTSMTGYQEILTDPSYAGQLMMMTYPHIGNYGAFEAATEADRPHVAGPDRARVRPAPVQRRDGGDAGRLHGAPRARRHLGRGHAPARPPRPRRGRHERRRLDRRRRVGRRPRRAGGGAPVDGGAGTREPRHDGRGLRRRRVRQPARGRLRLRRQAPHPAAVRGDGLRRARFPGLDAARRRHGVAAGRPLFLERPRRPARDDGRRRDGPRPRSRPACPCSASASGTSSWRSPRASPSRR